MTKIYTITLTEAERHAAMQALASLANICHKGQNTATYSACCAIQYKLATATETLADDREET